MTETQGNIYNSEQSRPIAAGVQRQKLKQSLRLVQKIVNRHCRLRDDAVLLHQIKSLLGGLEKSALNLGVVGAFSRDKSTFINALLGGQVVPTGYLPSTAYFTRISYGKTASAELFFRHRKPRSISLAESMKYVAINNKNNEGLEAIHIRYPAPILENGTMILDSPGFGSTYPGHREITTQCVEEADVLIFVFTSEPLLGDEECQFVRKAQARVGRVLCVQTKIDRHTDWPTRLKFNQMALEQHAGFTNAQIYPVSSVKMLAYQKSESETDYHASRFQDLETDIKFLFKEAQLAILIRKHRVMAHTAIANIRSYLQRERKDEESSKQKIQQKLVVLYEKITKLETNTQIILAESIKPLRLFCMEARHIVEITPEQIIYNYQRFISKVNTEELVTEAPTQLRNHLRATGIQMEQKINEELRQAIQTCQEFLAFSFSMARGCPELLKSFVLKGPIRRDLDPEIIYSPGRSDKLTGPAIVGGAIGTFFGGVVGAAIGASIGAGIGSNKSSERRMDLEATRKQIIENAIDVTQQFIDSFQEKLDKQLEDWLLQCEINVQVFIEQTTLSEHHSLSQSIQTLVDKASHAEEKIKQLHRDIKQLDEVNVSII